MENKKLMAVSMIILASCSAPNDKEAFGTITEKHILPYVPCMCNFEYWNGAQLQHYEFNDSCSSYQVGDKMYSKY